MWLVFFAAIFRVFPFLPTASACGFFFVAVPAPSWQFLFFGQSRSSSDRAGLVLSHFESGFLFRFPLTDRRLRFRRLILCKPPGRARLVPSVDRAWGRAPPRARHSNARHQTSTNIKMAVAQVSLVSAVKAAPVRASAGARRSARAVNVVAKAGVERFEVAKKAAPVALAVGASPPRSRRRSGDRAIGARFAPRRAARRVIARGVRSRVPIRAATPDDFRSRRRTLAGSARFANDRGSTRVRPPRETARERIAPRAREPR